MNREIADAFLLEFGIGDADQEDKVHFALDF
jgi:hypothetical protein